jgi:hypothetical protein
MTDEPNHQGNGNHQISDSSDDDFQDPLPPPSPKSTKGTFFGGSSKRSVPPVPKIDEKHIQILEGKEKEGGGGVNVS